MNDKSVAVRALPVYEQTTKFVKCCAFDKFSCQREPVPDELYCLQHCEVIREGAYRLCAFVSTSTGRRCSIVVGSDASTKEGYCPQHSRKIVQLRRDAVSRKRKHASNLDRTKVLLGYAERYGQYSAQRNKLTPPKDSANTPGYRKIVEHHDEPEIVNVMTDLPVSSFAEDITDFEFDEIVMNDPLRHAGVLTAEEIARIMRDKMIRLQKLYLDEFANLADQLTHNREQFKSHLKTEKLTLGPINEQTFRTVRDRQKLAMLRTRRRYHRVFGQEALLRDHMNAKRRHLDDDIIKRHPSDVTLRVTAPGGGGGGVGDECDTFDHGGPIIAKKQPGVGDGDNDDDAASSGGGLVIDEEDSKDPPSADGPPASGSAVTVMTCLASPCGNRALPHCHFCACHIHLDKRQLLFRTCSVRACTQRANVATAYACDPHLIQKQKESEYGDDTIKKLTDQTPQFCDRHTVPRSLHNTEWAAALLASDYQYEPKPKLDAIGGDGDEDDTDLSVHGSIGYDIPHPSTQDAPRLTNLTIDSSQSIIGDRIPTQMNEAGRSRADNCRKDGPADLASLLGPSGRLISQDYPNLVLEPIIDSFVKPLGPSSVAIDAVPTSDLDEKSQHISNFTVLTSNVPPPSDTLDDDILEILSDDDDDENVDESVVHAGNIEEIDIKVDENDGKVDKIIVNDRNVEETAGKVEESIVNDENVDNVVIDGNVEEIGKQLDETNANLLSDANVDENVVINETLEQSDEIVEENDEKVIEIFVHDENVDENAGKVDESIVVDENVDQFDGNVDQNYLNVDIDENDDHDNGRDSYKNSSEEPELKIPSDDEEPNVELGDNKSLSDQADFPIQSDIDQYIDQQQVERIANTDVVEDILSDLLMEVEDGLDPFD